MSYKYKPVQVNIYLNYAKNDFLVQKTTRTNAILRTVEYTRHIEKYHLLISFRKNIAMMLVDSKKEHDSMTRCEKKNRNQGDVCLCVASCIHFDYFTVAGQSTVQLPKRK
jgi:hypothetical protein